MNKNIKNLLPLILCFSLIMPSQVNAWLNDTLKGLLVFGTGVGISSIYNSSYLKGNPKETFAGVLAGAAAYGAYLLYESQRAQGRELQALKKKQEVDHEGIWTTFEHLDNACEHLDNACFKFSEQIKDLSSKTLNLELKDHLPIDDLKAVKAGEQKGAFSGKLDENNETIVQLKDEYAQLKQQLNSFNEAYQLAINTFSVGNKQAQAKCKAIEQRLADLKAQLDAVSTLNTERNAAIAKAVGTDGKSGLTRDVAYLTDMHKQRDVTINEKFAKLAAELAHLKASYVDAHTASGKERALQIAQLQKNIDALRSDLTETKTQQGQLNACTAARLVELNTAQEGAFAATKATLAELTSKMTKKADAEQLEKHKTAIAQQLDELKASLKQSEGERSASEQKELQARFDELTQKYEMITKTTTSLTQEHAYFKQHLTGAEGDIQDLKAGHKILLGELAKKVDEKQMKDHVAKELAASETKMKNYFGEEVGTLKTVFLPQLLTSYTANITKVYNDAKDTRNISDLQHRVNGLENSQKAQDEQIKQRLRISQFHDHLKELAKRKAPTPTHKTHTPPHSGANTPTHSEPNSPVNGPKAPKAPRKAKTPANLGGDSSSEYTRLRHEVPGVEVKNRLKDLDAASRGKQLTESTVPPLTLPVSPTLAASSIATTPVVENGSSSAAAIPAVKRPQDSKTSKLSPTAPVFTPKSGGKNSGKKKKAGAPVAAAAVAAAKTVSSKVTPSRAVVAPTLTPLALATTTPSSNTLLVTGLPPRVQTTTSVTNGAAAKVQLNS